MKTLIAALLVSITLIGCSKKTDKDFLNSADKSVKENKISNAVLSYENLIKDYPQSPLVPEAMFKLASLYQNNMVKSEPQQLALEKSVDLFKNIYKKYSDNKLAPKALFMAGFIQANNMKKFNDATATFNLFLQKYPDNSLSASVKEELKNMGLSPEEILQKKSKSHM